ncbi:hypothetical protein [Cellulosimicrobium cellulans]|uniref:hypothetical protein n=1 Tax=Cellulosimicrobium cellulans TaxID=1710 RepID=UPI00084881F9|nr:hypothetical protein [Cellulosimicrobium cellulans]
MGWYSEHVVEAGRAPALFALVGFVVTFVVVRAITRRIRARGASAGTGGTASTTSTAGTASTAASTTGPGDAEPADGRERRRLVGDVTIGGVHVHHQVWGILLVLLTGMLEFRYSPDSPWSEVLALLFGAGAALALDEFALWLYVDDVYWTPEGQRSIVAILVGGALGGALLLSTSPIGESPDDATAQGRVAYVVTVVVHLVLAFVTVLKGKLATGLIGVVVPVVALVGALRLAKPASYWARRWYAPRRMDRAERRFGPAYRARQERLRVLLGGAPSPEPSAGPSGSQPT